METKLSFRSASPSSLLGLLLSSEDGGDVFLRNVRLSPNYKVISFNYTHCTYLLRWNYTNRDLCLLTYCGVFAQSKKCGARETAVAR
jgi:hypothetical protein